MNKKQDIVAHVITINYEKIENTIITQTAISQAFVPHKNKISPASKDFKIFKGLWDTGATNTAITQKVVDECKLVPIAMKQIQHAGGIEACEVYLVNVVLRNNILIPQLRVSKVNLGPDIDILIGMDLINQGDFAITNKNGKTTFSFRIPSLETIDFKEIKSNTPAPILHKKGHNIGRNNPCPCGSGKRFKNCCIGKV